MLRSSLIVLMIVGMCTSFPMRVFAQVNGQEADIQTQQLVGRIVSVDEKALSFDLEYIMEEATGEKKVSTFYVTDITTIDIALTQANLSDLKPGLNVLVEYALMPDGARVVESVWVKNV